MAHRKNTLGAAFILACAALICLPLAIRMSCGHDLTFHMESWMDAARSWHQGILYPRWSGSAWWGAGEARYIFYPPLPWMLGGIIGILFGWKAAPVVFIFVVLVIGGLATYRFASQWLDSRSAAIAACLYLANPYNLFVIYMRDALSELLAAAVVPWLVAEALRPRFRGSIFALAMAVLWLTNAPAAVFATYSVALLLIFRAIQERSPQVLLPAAAATALGFAMDAFYLIPAAYERRFVQPERILTVGYDFRNNFIFSHTTDGLHDGILLKASLIGFALITGILLCSLAIFVTRANLAPVPRPLLPLLVLAAIAFLMQFRFTTFLWTHAPELPLPQFPWRWYFILGLVFAFAAALVINPLRKAGPWFAAAFILLTISACYWRMVQACDPEDLPAAIRQQFLTQGFEGQDEFVPHGADSDDIRPTPDSPGYPQVWLYRADDASSVDSAPADHVRMLSAITIDKWKNETKSFHLETHIPAVAVLQLEDFPAWRVRLDGQEVAKLTPASSGQIQIAIPPGAHEVTVSFDRTRDRLLGILISIMAIGCWLWFMLLEEHHAAHAHVSS